MKNLLTLSLLAALILPSCSVVQSARDKLETMSEADYQTFKNAIVTVSEVGGDRLGVALGDRRQSAITAIGILRPIVGYEWVLDTNDVIKDLIDRYGKIAGLTTSELNLLNDIYKAIDAGIGQVKLDITGRLSDRELGLVLALLDGMERGLS